MCFFSDHSGIKFKHFLLINLAPHFIIENEVSVEKRKNVHLKFRYTHCHQVDRSLDVCHIYYQVLLVDSSFHLLKILPEDFSFVMFYVSQFCLDMLFNLMRHYYASRYFVCHLQCFGYIYVGYLKVTVPPIKYLSPLKNHFCVFHTNLHVHPHMLYFFECIFSFV